jgi:N-acetylmuramic acid 6-phosphate etherase
LKQRVVRTERENPVSDSLDVKSTLEVLRLINLEDRKVAPAVARTIPQIARAVDLSAKALATGGRLVYLGAGTSGRLAVLDAAECYPTFGTDRIQAVMAGAPEAFTYPTEASEDDPRLAVRDLRRIKFNHRDILLGISASGCTPYTLGGMRYARRLGATVLGLTSNPAAALSRLADVVIAPVVGPEIVAGSSRMKAGTAQKLVLNMLSTATMVSLGRVLSGWMINIQLKNRKLWQRGQRILMKAAGVGAARAETTLKQAGGNLPLALLMLVARISKGDARELLETGVPVARLLREALSKSRPAPIRALRRRGRKLPGYAQGAG